MQLKKILGSADRQWARPGPTAIAQVYAPHDIPPWHPFTYDALYIERQRFWLDLKLIALSCWMTFRGTWEHRGKTFSHPVPVPAMFPAFSSFSPSDPVICRTFSYGLSGRRSLMMK